MRFLRVAAVPSTAHSGKRGARRQRELHRLHHLPDDLGHHHGGVRYSSADRTPDRWVGYLCAEAGASTV